MSVNKSKRNRNAGSHPSYKKKGMSKKAIANKRKYDKAYGATKDAKDRRVELNRINRNNHKSGKSKVGDKKDVSHKKDGKTVLEKQKTNRARNGQNGKSTRK